jgi:hypothetical protein
MQMKPLQQQPSSPQMNYVHHWKDGMANKAVPDEESDEESLVPMLHEGLKFWSFPETLVLL